MGRAPNQLEHGVIAFLHLERSNLSSVPPASAHRSEGLANLGSAPRGGHPWREKQGLLRIQPAEAFMIAGAKGSENS